MTVVGVLLCQPPVSMAKQSGSILEQIGVTRGICVVPGDGGVLWSHSLPAAPVEWGLAIDKEGRAVVTLTDGRILCFGEGGQI